MDSRPNLRTFGILEYDPKRNTWIPRAEGSVALQEYLNKTLPKLK